MTKSLDTLQGKLGAEYWRTLDELAASPEFQELVEREFSGPPGGWTDGVSRRQFLMLMAASLGLAGLSGCSVSPAPAEKVLPFVRPPAGRVTGVPLYFATAMPLPGDALGLLVKSYEGRPIKVEGNPDHPSSPRPAGAPDGARFGATNVFAQASILSLYDPHRSGSVQRSGQISTWETFLSTVGARLRDRGRALRLRILTESITSPSQAHEIQRVLERYPAARWHVYEPVGNANVSNGARQAFGEVVAAQYRLDRADVVLALDSDFLNGGPGSVRHQHDFALRRRVRQGHYERMNRLYVAESTPSGTGAAADHRMPVRSRDIARLARALAAGMDARFRVVAADAPIDAAWLDALRRDLLAHRGSSLILAGPAQPPFVHALVHALNDFLGNAGQTVTYTQTASIETDSRSLRELTDAMAAGEVDVLLILGGNPVYTAPTDLAFGERMNRVPLRIHLGLYANETSAACQWHLPEAHFLESWGDVRSHDGTLSIVQPLISPLRQGKTASEVVSMLLQPTPTPSYDIVRSHWRGEYPGDFEAWWRRALHDGLAADTRFPARSVTLQANWHAGAEPVSPDRELEVVFRADPTLFDGRYAENGWLQELPRPISKITWDNAILISPATAVRLGFADANHPEQANEKVVTLSCDGRTVEGPLWVQPGHADDSVTVHIGFGRTNAGPVGSGVGFNAYAIRTSGAPGFSSGVTLTATGARHSLATTQHHHLMENRELVRTGTAQHPPHIERPRRITLYDDADHPQAREQWGMVIDLNVCTGCSACIIACQAENNIPVVGKEEVSRGREMHWLRVDSYYHGAAAKPDIYFQPVPCMHCENAPCELVCPVGATVHSTDGLNEMVYNRCVGTRYCSNNCPYKVRRFNFLQYADFDTESLRLMRNPGVTTRSRGVMEKCTYCVQRIRVGQIEAQREDRALSDFEVMTACQSACPAGAIVFGDLANQPRSQVAQLRQEPLQYALLDELNARPRTTYLAAVKNPNPDIA